MNCLYSKISRKIVPKMSPGISGGHEKNHVFSLYFDGDVDSGNRQKWIHSPFLQNENLTFKLSV